MPGRDVRARDRLAGGVGRVAGHHRIVLLPHQDSGGAERRERGIDVLCVDERRRVDILVVLELVALAEEGLQRCQAGEVDLAVDGVDRVDGLRDKAAGTPVYCSMIARLAGSLKPVAARSRQALR